MSSLAKGQTSSLHLSCNLSSLTYSVWLPVCTDLRWPDIVPEPISPTFDSKVEKQREQHPSCWTFPLPCLHNLDLMVVSRTSSATPVLIRLSLNSFAPVSVSFSLSSLPSHLLCSHPPPGCSSSSSPHTKHTPQVAFIRGAICRHSQILPVLVHQMFLIDRTTWLRLFTATCCLLHIATAPFCPQDGRRISESNRSILSTQQTVT